MSKKRKHPSQKARDNARKIRQQLNVAERQLLARNYPQVVSLCQNILGATLPKSRQRADALEYLSHAYVMLKRFEEAYDALSEVVTITPDEAYIWYDKSVVALYSGRSGQALLDIKRAQALEGKEDMAEEYAQKLAFIENIVKQERELRGPDFTLAQLIEQQELFRKAMDVFDAGDWVEAEGLFRQVIAMGDCVSQPQNNLGVCLLMQGRFDGAEAAFKQALEIEPGYKLARQHLKQLKKTKKTGELPQVVTNRPFKDAKITSRFVKRGSFFKR